MKTSGLCSIAVGKSRNERDSPLLAVFGHEVSGVVAAAGSGVTEFSVGDHVVGGLVRVVVATL